MNVLAASIVRLAWRTPALRRGALSCVLLAVATSATEIAVAMSLIPIMASLGVDAGEEVSAFVSHLPAEAWLAIFVVLAVVRSGLRWQSSVQGERGTQELIVSLQSRLYRALSGAHWDTIRRISPPKLTSALQTQAYDAGYGFSGMVQVIAATLLVLGYLVSAAVVLPIVLPVFLLILIVMWRLNAGGSTRIYAQAEDYHESQTDLHQRYEDWVAISQIASLGVDSGKLGDRFEADARAAATHSIGFSRSYAATRVRYEAAVVVAILIGVPVAWWLETPPALLAFGLVVLVRILPQAGGIHVGYHSVVNAAAPLSNIEHLVTQLESDPAARSSAEETLTWRHLSLTDIGVEDTLRDDETHSILRDISLDLAHGEWLAVTGTTGSGKTTLVNVMLMLLRPTAGNLRIDGRDLDEELASRWRDQAAYVPQDVVLFDASIRNNLRLYAPDASDDELKAVLRKSAADFVIDQLPEGLDTKAGPGGRWLSGGERQRIGIARALLRNPGFLVLDEPTAALDTDTQQKLMAALSALEHTMSVVLITHRPELLKLADRVIEIEDGVVVSRPQGGLPQE